MRIAIFGSGGAIPIAALRALHPVADVAVAIRPGPPTGLARLRGVARRLLRGSAEPDELSKLAAELGVAERQMQGPGDPALAPCLRGLKLDLACVATFPWRLRADVLSAPARGTLNAHSSILPRHRGPNPWLWTYHANDKEAGVTIHVCDAGLDSGPIVRQAVWPLERGYPVAALHRDVATRGAAMLAEIVGAMGRGETVPATAQDPALVTEARRVSRGTALVDYHWPAERIWHFLAGMVGQFSEPLRCAGAPIQYNRVPGYQVTAPKAPAGTVESVRDEAWRLWCHDGFVMLERSARPGHGAGREGSLILPPPLDRAFR